MGTVAAKHSLTRRERKNGSARTIGWGRSFDTVSTVIAMVIIAKLQYSPECAAAFAPTIRFIDGGVGPVNSLTELRSTPPPSRQKPRRLLKKRRSRRGEKNRRRDGFGYSSTKVEEDNDDKNVEVEFRPLVRSRSVEAGEDYWIDESEWREWSQAREEEKERRTIATGREGLASKTGRIPESKLWEETLAPYRQNWIGYFSVFIVIMATMVTQFPELLQTPTIPFPDL